MQTVALNNGVKMLTPGFGVFQIPDAQCERVVGEALGRAVRRSGVPRDELFVTLLHPPELGIRGDSHMVMEDRNNLQIADLILTWTDGHTRGQPRS